MAKNPDDTQTDALAPAEAPAPTPVEVKPVPAPAPSPVLDTKTAAPVASGMPFLGVMIAPGQTHGRGGPPAALPLIIKGGTLKAILGVVVVGDPGWFGATLDAHLKQAGYKGPFEQIPPGKTDAATKLACARAIIAQTDPALDKVGALGSFGFTPGMAK